MRNQFETWYRDKFGDVRLDYDDKIVAALYECWCDGYFIGWSAASV